MFGGWRGLEKRTHYHSQKASVEFDFEVAIAYIEDNGDRRKVLR